MSPKFIYAVVALVLIFLKVGCSSNTDTSTKSQENNHSEIVLEKE